MLSLKIVFEIFIKLNWLLFSIEIRWAVYLSANYVEIRFDFDAHKCYVFRPRAYKVKICQEKYIFPIKIMIIISYNYNQQSKVRHRLMAIDYTDPLGQMS